MHISLKSKKGKHSSDEHKYQTNTGQTSMHKMDPAYCNGRLCIVYYTPSDTDGVFECL